MSTDDEFRGVRESDILARIESGTMIADIAEDMGCPRSSLTMWLRATPDRSARLREARRLGAASWEERAEKGLSAARDPFELAKAKELAHHYRWRASKLAPSDFGDKIEHTGPNGGAIQVERIERVVIDPQKREPEN